MTLTEFFGLKKPARIDNFRVVDHFDYNMDAIDAQMKANADAAAAAALAATNAQDDADQAAFEADQAAAAAAVADGKAVAAQNTANAALVAPTIVQDLASTTKTIATAADNTKYKFGTLTALTVSAYPTGSYEFAIYFTAGVGITVSLPVSTKWLGGSVPVWTSTKAYEISIRDGYAVAGEF